ncbi:BamA/TamA family outer membrane protein [Ferruginibacter sp. HRS2-29]|uniref:ShlB/FhaC/HecB family hemolysin secretion/activation protein n=1 Tax=Ferruginibacter sp. HRS2-29 TaxID=2487334 RepID=UPI0020CEA24E|nr:BamA/TamA family outer membrane protein [Ferruginibacter sp. HRS2-29]
MNFFCKYTTKAAAVLVLACLLLHPAVAQHANAPNKGFPMHYHLVGKDSSFNVEQLGLQQSFSNSAEAYGYIVKLPALLASKGYPVASADSIWEVNNELHVDLYPGTKYNLVQLQVNNVEPAALEAGGYIEKNFTNKPLNISQLQLLQQRILGYYEKNGHPFAKVYLDSIRVEDDKITAALKTEKGVLYHIDSIRVFGNIKINKRFLQRYLSIPNGSIYSKERLGQVDKKMLELPYLTPVQSSDLTMLGSGAVLNLYVQPKRSSQVNFLVGFLPSGNDSKKLQVTGDVNLDLKNLLGTGENFLLKWQQLQPKSPRLNLGFDQPYIFNSPFGFNFLFDLFKKDSSFIQVNAQAGVQFSLANNQTGKLFVQLQNASLLEGAIDTNVIKVQKTLPLNIDVSAVNVGFNYEWQGTNYRFNPRKGNEVNLVSVVGIKNIKKNNTITSLKDPSFNYESLYDSIKLKSYQLRVKLAAAHYFPIGKAGTFKLGVNSGYYTSPSIFRNELFQIGGYKLLRGFDEESIYATQYAVATAEYRYLIGLNSYLFTFVDVGWVNNKYQDVALNNKFTGGGLGILFETKAGLLNLSLAVGKRNDVKFNLRESSKIHFGYINYF